MPSAKDVTFDTEHYKVMVVGEPGTGKSVFAATFPKPAFLFDFDDTRLSYAGLDVEYETYEKSWKGWVEFEKDLVRIKKEVADKFKTVIVDSTSTMTDTAMERAMQLDPKRNAVDGPLWNVHYQMVKNLIEGRLRQIVNLKANVVVISHLELKTDGDTGAIISAEPLLTGTLSSKIPGYFDEVYHATTRRKDGETKYFLQTVPIGLYKARSRLSGKQRRLPDFIENDYETVMKTLREKLQ